MKRALIGCGGHAQEVMAQIGKKLLCFVEDEFLTKETKPMSEFDPKKYKVMVAFGDSKKGLMSSKNYRKKLNILHLFTQRQY